jgi:hypothetical protein
LINHWIDPWIGSRHPLASENGWSDGPAILCNVWHP